MGYVTTALKGYWGRIANDENGSLVVQCIFEHSPPQSKAPVLNEILTALHEISKGQWGNWVVQHILDHGTASEKSIVFKTVLRDVYGMSVDQYASKVVEKALRTAGKWELTEMINVVISRKNDNM